MAAIHKKTLRERRQMRTRKRVVARATRPLLTVFRSSKHLYAQIDDPLSGRTVTSVSTLSAGIREGLESSKDIEAAKKVGQAIARLALERSIQEVTFNRNGFVYTGRIKAMADAAREAGLKF